MILLQITKQNSLSTRGSDKMLIAAVYVFFLHFNYLLQNLHLFFG